ncbi:hypothetical protein FYJ27_10685 [Anaerosalibacter bizertensis]|uniref:Uncharacterized protein n=1 Tax=Anaerosalibacter bizertensis TaxID=932217 RepID=A0A844FJQ7_9FIRM|nr:hypothetical protein [Anaerosalibacter bizertensis]MSS44171.1 hypothetical protein [Anaerosalibacter bizertensis]
MLELKEYRRIMDIEREYKGRIENTSYLNSLILTEDEIWDIGKYLGYFISNNDFKRMENVLLVYSVSIAYHYYDDTGYWPHFYKYCGLTGNIVYNEEIGQVIEFVLMNKGYLEFNRVGPFRYVGAILEQTGITKRSIPIFAEIVRTTLGKNSYRRNDIKSKTDFKYYLESINCPDYLKKYLIDESGWKFTIQVFKIMDYLNKKILTIEDIFEIRGFYPGFWEEFFKYFHLYKFDKRKVNISPIIDHGRTEKQVFDFNKELTLRWASKPDYMSEDGKYNIFYLKLPELNIENKYLLDNKIYFLFYDIGSGPQRVKDVDRLMNYIKEEPCTIGEIWAEPFDRRNTKFDTEPFKPLKFCYISKKHTKLPISKYKDEKDIILESNTDKLEFIGCFKYKDNPNFYMIPKGLEKIKIKVKHYKYSTSFILPIKWISEPRTSLRKANNKEGLYEEWKEDVLNKRGMFFKSEIASLPEGKNLTRAWKLYRNNNIKAIGILKNIKGVDKIVDELKQVLICLLYLKNFRINIIEDEIGRYAEGNFADILLTYKNYRSIIYGDKLISSSLIKEDVFNLIPFLKEDKELIKNINYIIHNKKIDNYSWVELVLMYKIEVKKGNRNNIYRDELKRIYKYIPDSPEKGELLKDLHK